MAVLLLQSSIGVLAEETHREGKIFPSGNSYEEIGSQIEAYVKEREKTTAGMAVAVFDGEGTIYKSCFGYADKENTIAVNDETVFEWGSATKLLVWISVMQLWEQGKIDLECDVRTYLSDGFMTNLNYDTPVTMINLMNHNAGFQEVYSDLFLKEGTEIPTLEEALRAHEPEQIYEPGEVTAYSNWGVALAGYIVERVSGMGFDEYVHQNIFEPLNMEHSALSTDLHDNEWVREQRKNLQCYTAEGELIPDCFYYISLYPAGMCTSTLADFERFGQAIADPSTVLFQHEDTWKELFSPTAFYGDSSIPSNCHGLWVLPYAVKTVGHGGNTAGCSSYLLIEPEEGIGVCVMTNQAQEEIYNEKMMEFVFGQFQEENYFESPREMPEGIYRSARTVRKGPFKCLSLSYVSGDWEKEEFWVYSSSDEIEKISYTYVDLLKVPIKVFVLEMGLFLLWLAALAFSLLSLIVKGMRKLINWMKHRESKEIVLGRWSALCSVFQLILLILMSAAAYMISNYELSKRYIWIFGVIGGFGIVMVGMIIYGVIKFFGLFGKREKQSTGRKIYNALTVFFSIVTVINILYWNLYL